MSRPATSLDLITELLQRLNRIQIQTTNLRVLLENYEKLERAKRISNLNTFLDYLSGITDFGVSEDEVTNIEKLATTARQLEINEISVDINNSTKIVK